MTFRLTTAQHDATLAKLDAINTRAQRKGFTGRVTLTSTPVVWWEFIDADADDIALRSSVTEPDYTEPVLDQWRRPIPGCWVAQDGFDVVLGGDAPCYDGWEFTAILDWDNAGSGQLIVRTAPGTEGPAVDRSKLIENYCSECKTTRDRKETYLVRNLATGEERQIGRTCIKDFLGHTGSIAWLDTDAVRRELEEEWGLFGAATPDSFPVDRILALSWAAIRTHGYRRSAEPCSTRDIVTAALTGKGSKGDKALAADLAPLITEGLARAAEIRTWLLSDEFTGGTDYVHNLKALAGAERCGYRNLGFLVSGPQQWLRAQEDTAARADVPVSEWIGTPHAPKTKVTAANKVTVTAEIIAVTYPASYRQSYYSTETQTDTRYVLRTAKGEVLVWQTGSSVLGDDRGATVTITGTVKAHEEWKGTKQTVLTRCKLLQPAAAAA